MAKKKSRVSNEEIQNIELKIPRSPKSCLTVTIEGTEKLVVNKFSEKAKMEIRTKQQSKAKTAKKPRDPDLEFEGSRYIMTDGSDGFPTGAVAEAILTASIDPYPKKKSELRRNLFVKGNGYDEEHNSLIRIENAEAEMREDTVRLAGPSRAADLRYRASYAPGWRATFQVFFNEDVWSRDKIVQLLMIAGESVGLCEGRREKTLALGWGSFQLAQIQYAPGKKVAEILDDEAA